MISSSPGGARKPPFLRARRAIEQLVTVRRPYGAWVDVASVPRAALRMPWATILRPTGLRWGFSSSRGVNEEKTPYRAATILFVHRSVSDWRLGSPVINSFVRQHDRIIGLCPYGRRAGRTSGVDD